MAPAAAEEGPATRCQPLSPSLPEHVTHCRPLGSHNLGLTSLGDVQPIAVTAEGPTTRSQPLPLPPWECAPVHLHTPYQGNNSRHVLRKVTSSIETKNSPCVKKKY